MLELDCGAVIWRRAGKTVRVPKTAVCVAHCVPVPVMCAGCRIVGGLDERQARWTFYHRAWWCPDCLTPVIRVEERPGAS